MESESERVLSFTLGLSQELSFKGLTGEVLQRVEELAAMLSDEDQIHRLRLDTVAVMVRVGWTAAALGGDFALASERLDVFFTHPLASNADPMEVVFLSVLRAASRLRTGAEEEASRELRAMIAAAPTSSKLRAVLVPTLGALHSHCERMPVENFATQELRAVVLDVATMRGSTYLDRGPLPACLT